MFDILALDVLSPSEEGRDFTPVHPKTRKPWLDSEGKPVTFTVLGRWAGIAQQAAEAIEARNAARPANSPPLTIEERQADEAEYAAAFIRRWSFTHFGGEEFPCTPANARKLLLDPRMSWLLLQLRLFHGDDGNFLAEPTKPASPGQNEPSA